jgi:Arc/MetJ family transcription regulator
MRTNIVLNDDLVREAMTFSQARSKRELIEEALRVYVEAKAEERRRLTYGSRLQKLRARCAELRFRTAPHDLIREDRDRR